MPKVTVSEVQQALKDNGYDIGPDGVDGDWGDNSARALGQFQVNNRLEVTGRADLATLRLLLPERYPTRNNPMDNILGGIFTGLLGNLFRSQALMGYIRNILLGLGSGFVTNGLVTDLQWQTVVGAILAILGVVFDAISNATKQKAIDVVKAVDAAPAVTVVPASESPTKKPIVVTQP